MGGSIVSPIRRGMVRQKMRLNWGESPGQSLAVAPAMFILRLINAATAGL